MIAYQVQGRAKNLSKRRIDSMMSFAVDYLSLMQYEDLWIDLLITSDFREGEFGFCNGLDDGIVELELNKSLSEADFAVTLFHELVHARQVLEGRLVQGECSQPTTWDGVAFHDKYPYHLRPWEKEAHELEKIMLEKFYES